MPRPPTWGTPGRASHYPGLRKKYALWLPAILIGAVAVGLYAVLALGGLREALSPGPVTSAHANVDTRCEACHTTGRHSGASNLRCQRCHDTGGAGRLTQASHVFFGSGSASKAAASAGLACARCHIEHRGSDARLSAVAESQCLRCHGAWRAADAAQAYRIADLVSHPDFRVRREKLLGDPRLLFSHKRHMKEMIKEGAPGEWETCIRCHSPQPGSRSRDFEPISFDVHCARCHTDDLVMEPVPASDVLEDVGIRGAAGPMSKVGDTIQKTTVRHRDEWVLYNLRRLQWMVHPEAYAADRAALQARASQLERRLALAEPLVGLTADQLRERKAGVEEEIRRIEGRLAARPSVQSDAVLARIEEAAAAVAAAGDARQAEQLRAAAAALGKGGVASRPLTAADLEARRRELLSVLDAVLVAEPSRSRTVADLRRRLLAISPGEAVKDNLSRALAQRKDEQARLRDEIALRDGGMHEEVRSLPEVLSLQRELADVKELLGRYYSFDGAPPAVNAQERERKLDSLRKLSGEGTKDRCAKCHLLGQGSLLPTRPARSVMVRAAFAHRKHLDAPLPQLSLWQRITGRASGLSAVRERFRCAYCHEGIEKAGDAPRPPAIPAVESCRACHAPGLARLDCQLCHRYHPAGSAS